MARSCKGDLNWGGPTRSPDSQLSAQAQLKDLRGDIVAGAACHYSLDVSVFDFYTDAYGEHEFARSASDLGFGAHSIQALFEGELPYAPSSSAVNWFEVTIPTNITLETTSSRIFTGYYLVGTGMLFANSTQALPDQQITLSVDGIAVDNVTTDSEGQFSFSISTEDLAIGAHAL